MAALTRRPSLNPRKKYCPSAIDCTSAAKNIPAAQRYAAVGVMPGRSPGKERCTSCPPLRTVAHAASAPQRECVGVGVRVCARW